MQVNVDLVHYDEHTHNKQEALRAKLSLSGINHNLS